MTEDSIQVDDLVLDIRRSDRRKTIGITIDRDGSLSLATPRDASYEQINQFVKLKQSWIYTKLAEKEIYTTSPTRRPEYVNGEGFYYLGRSYRLKIVESESQRNPILLKRGRFRLRNDARDGADKHFVNWYITHGQPWLARRVERFTGRVDVEPEGVKVRKLGYRWGSCNPIGTLNFNWRTVKLPVRIIDYIVVHELVHLRVQHHTDEFWNLVKRAMPDYKERRNWLAENGSQYG